jgi:RND family efflux transporter MFP subunit
MKPRTLLLPRAARAARVLAAGFALAPALVGCGDTPGGATEAAATLPVEGRRVGLEPGYEVAELHAGRVVSRRTSQLGFDRPGRIARVEVDEGDAVEPGRLLATLDTGELRAERRRVEAQIGEIEAQLAMAHLTTQRRQALRASDHLSPEQLDRAVYSERALAARLASARAAREAVDASLAMAEIRAPYAGTIVARLADEGSVAAPGTPILRLIEAGALEAQIGLPPEAAAALRVGDAHTLEIEGRPAPAVLRAVIDTVERDTRTVTAIFRLEGAAAAQDGALARVRLARRLEAPGFWLPLGALAESHRGLWSAYVLVPAGDGDGDGGGGGDAEPALAAGTALRAERRQVEVLHSEAERAFVRGTLRDGDTVVWSGAHRLVPRQLVRRVEPRADPGAGPAPEPALDAPPGAAASAAAEAAAAAAARPPDPIAQEPPVRTSGS